MAPKNCAYPDCGLPVEGEGNYCGLPHPRRRKRITKQKSEVIIHFADRFGMKRAQVEELFHELSSLAAQEVKKNGEFVLPGFGKLILSNRKAREGRNPATGETMQIPAKTTLKFRVGKG